MAEVAELMIEKDIHRGIVMGGDRVQGVITTMDLIRLFRR